MNLKNLIGENLKKIIEYSEIKRLKKAYKDIKKIIFLSSPEHTNLGDHAIAIAIEKILKDTFENMLILEFSFSKYRRNAKYIQDLVNDEDIIVTIGGGNFGNLYLYEEEQRRDIVQRFSKNKIIIMPQSIFFTNDENGKIEIEKSNEIYSNHKNLNIMTRDKKSYENGKKYFPKNKIYLSPDSVLYLEDWINKLNSERNGVILTLRSDKEKNLSENNKNSLVEFLLKNKISFFQNDTIQKYPITKELREYEVKNMLNKISTAKVNITDRFHGVIFSVITNTPVIVFKSLDHKIEEGVKWFSEIEWVHYVTSIEEAEILISKYIKLEVPMVKDNYRLKEKLKEVFLSI